MSLVSLPRTRHDALARYVFGRPNAAAIELRHVLPPPLIDTLDLATLRPIPASTTRPSLGPRDSDLLFEVDPLGFVAPPIRVSIDHQSSPDARMPLRTLVYTGEQWDRFAKAQPDSPLPLVIPVLLVQPPARATPSRLSDLITLPPGLREWFRSPIELTHYVDDLSGSVLDDPFADNGHRALVEATRILLYAYKNDDPRVDSRLQTLGPLFDDLVEHFGPQPDEVRELLAYITGTFDADSPIHAIIMQTFSKEAKEMYVTLADQWHAEGFDKGIATARAEAVLGVLACRGLEIPPAIRERVLTTSDADLLQRWLDRAVTAPSVAGVFEHHDG